MRFFNTTGPVRPDKHYSIPPLERPDLDDVLDLVRDERYFVLHAPRQTGKTSALLALRDLLNSGAEGEYRCVYANVEAAQAMREDVEQAMRAILDELASWARSTLGDECLEEIWPGILARSGPAGALRETLSRWAEADPRPLVLLIAIDAPLRIANPLYAEVVPRELTYAAQAGLVEDTAWYVDAAGGLDVVKLLAAFQAFFREHSEHWVARFDYQEAGPQLLLQALLQRIVNGGGRIEREYGLGRRRTDLLTVWPQGERTRKFVVECKVLHKSLERTLREGLEQAVGYMDRCAAEAGHLVIFDRSEDRSWDEKVFRRGESAGGTDITVWGM